MKFELGGKQYKTKVVWKNLDPSWEETFEIQDKSLKYNNLSIVFTVMDKDVVGSDDYMGETQSVISFSIFILFCFYLLFGLFLFLVD